MNKKSDNGYFTRSMFFKSVLLSPFAGIGLALAEIGDAIIAGHGIGMTGLAAVGYFSPLFLFFTFLAFGMSTGGAIAYNDLMNEGKKDEALGIFNTFVLVSSIISIFLTVIIYSMKGSVLHLLGADPDNGEVYRMAENYMVFVVLGGPFAIISEVLSAYLRNDKDVNFSVALQTFCGISNLAISALLLFVCGWGVAGCSFGYFISNAVSVVISIIYILCGKGELKFKAHFVELKKIIKPLRLGFSTSAEYIFGAVFTLVFIHVLSNLSGVEGVAVYNVIEGMSILFIYMFEMIGKTAQPIFTIYNAEHNKFELRRILKYCSTYSLFFGVVFAAIIKIYPQVLTLLFGMEDISDVTVVYNAANIFGLGAVFMGISLLMQNFTQSLGNDKGVFALVFLRKLGFGVPLMLLLSLLGVDAVWFVYPLTEILSQIVFFTATKIKDRKKSGKDDNIYCTSFTLNNTNVFEELDSIEMFFSEHGIDKIGCTHLRFSIEEICAAINEYGKKNNRILVQLTLIGNKNGEVEVHLRDNAEKHDLFSSIPNRITAIPETISDADIRGLGLLVVRHHARNLLYRNYQGFNTLTYRI